MSPIVLSLLFVAAFGDDSAELGEDFYDQKNISSHIIVHFSNNILIY